MEGGLGKSSNRFVISVLRLLSLIYIASILIVVVRVLHGSVRDISLYWSLDSCSGKRFIQWYAQLLALCELFLTCISQGYCL